MTEASRVDYIYGRSGCQRNSHPHPLDHSSSLASLKPAALIAGANFSRDIVSTSTVTIVANQIY